jgi:hypothetical protein
LQAIEAQFASSDLNIGVQRHKMMAASPLSRNAHVSHYAAYSAPANKDAVAFPPYAIQFREEVFVILEVTHLIVVVRGILLQRPVRW